MIPPGVTSDEEKEKIDLDTPGMAVEVDGDGE